MFKIKLYFIGIILFCALGLSGIYPEKTFAISNKNNRTVVIKVEYDVNSEYYPDPVESKWMELNVSVGERISYKKLLGYI
ncbi:TPA: hypothetical protein ACLQU7_005703 [Bacillus tropicus]|uniref:hypothetical protein n=1 Tax=Bacillus cereus group TaxID=86661 RepID=UPI00003CB59D|nr:MULTISPECIES: hypothetical protein [Bacillus cereus group]AIY72866.1 hypothetical protein NT98_5834 [Bacillus cereus]AJI08043.1 hypothetical protein AQ16_5551 [Bacillus cereus G9241]EAL15928.1 hypothetical protein protein [Bacillus cereus G9241]QPS53560.1 hypothetical protein I6G54_28695 [Bacillus tropicus]